MVQMTCTEKRNHFILSAMVYNVHMVAVLLDNQAFLPHPIIHQPPDWMREVEREGGGAGEGFLAACKNANSNFKYSIVGMLINKYGQKCGK